MMAHRLALATGCLHPTDILEQLTSRELSQWTAYYNLAPFGQDHTDWLLAQLAAVLVNVMGSRKSQYSPSDFLPLYRPPPQSPEAMFAVVRSAKGARNGHRRHH
jgi:hypothetical protein